MVLLVRHPYTHVLLLAHLLSKTSLGQQHAVLEGKGFNATSETFTALALKILFICFQQAATD